MKAVVVRMSDILKNNPTMRMDVDYVINKVERKEIINQMDTLEYKLRLLKRKLFRWIRSGL